MDDRACNYWTLHQLGSQEIARSNQSDTPVAIFPHRAQCNCGARRRGTIYAKWSDIVFVPQPDTPPHHLPTEVYATNGYESTPSRTSTKFCVAERISIIKTFTTFATFTLPTFPRRKDFKLHNFSRGNFSPNTKWNARNLESRNLGSNFRLRTWTFPKVST